MDIAGKGAIPCSMFHVCRTTATVH